jgi:hypothetical protein
MKHTRWFVLGIFSSALAGCGSSDDGDREHVGEVECDNALSGFAGDCLALQAPEPGKGFQLHFGPSNYDDSLEVERFVLQPGDEKVTCLYSTAPNEQDVYFSGYHATVRPGTHHMIIWAGADGPNSVAPPDGTMGDCKDNLPFLVGAQNGIDPSGGRIQIPAPGRKVAPENEGLAMVIPARARIAFQVHYVNNGQEPLLQESWANFVYRPKEEVKQVTSPLFWIGGLDMNVAPKSRSVVKAQCTNDSGETRRLVSLVGHMHAHGTRFSAFKVKANSAERELVYEEFDWSHSTMFPYDSVNENPEPDAERRRAGATSGELLLEPGDRIEWECEVNNTSDKPLKFADEAYSAEMCNLFGGSTPGAAGAWNCFNP